MEVKRLLNTTRLLTLTGPGGRLRQNSLALQAAAEAEAQFAEGVWIAEYAALTAPELTPQTVIRTLRVSQEGTTDPLEFLCQYLGRAATAAHL